MKKEDTLCIILAAIVLGAVGYYFLYKKKNVQNFVEYSEYNDSCKTGAVECRLSTGDLGMCDASGSGRCIWKNETTSYDTAMDHVSYGAPFPTYYNMKTSNSIYKEIHPNCLEGLNVCNMSDNSSGVCYLGGICSPNSMIVR